MLTWYRFDIEGSRLSQQIVAALRFGGIKTVVAPADLERYQFMPETRLNPTDVISGVRIFSGRKYRTLAEALKQSLGDKVLVWVDPLTSVPGRQSADGSISIFVGVKPFEEVK